jgi:ATP-dependent Clp protease ATP-binding subunit ClpC
MTPSDFILSSPAGKKLTNHAKNSIVRAIRLAKKTEEGKLKNIHLFYSILSESGSMGSLMMKDMGFKKQNFSGLSEKADDLEKTPPESREIAASLSESVKNTLVRSFRIAQDLKSGYVGTEHMIYALVESDDQEIRWIMGKIKNKKTKKVPGAIMADRGGFNLENIADRLLNFSNFGNASEPFRFGEMEMPRAIAAGQKKNALSYIQKFATNVNDAVLKNQEMIIGREREIERMIYILGRKNKNNPLLVGHPGVGKTALVYGLAKMINDQKVPPALFDKKIMNLDVASLVAGTSFRGEFEARLKEVIREATLNKNIILFIDEIHNITGAGNIAGSLDLANIIKPALSQGDIRLIGATTFPEFKKNIEKDAALERRFQPIHVKEPDIDQTKLILSGVKERYEEFHNVKTGEKIIDLAVELSSRYIKNRFLPDKAIDVIDETASYIRSKALPSKNTLEIRELEIQRKKIIAEKERLIKVENYAKAIEMRMLQKDLERKIDALKESQKVAGDGKIEISAEDVYRTIARMSGIPEQKLGKDNGEKLKNIGQVMNKSLVGQPEAVEKISSVLLRSQSGLENENRPLGSFLFMGPTGVGKTLTAKVLAREFFSDPEAFIRIDMSEFTERHTVSSLIGSPAGYIGYGEGGRLTEQVKRNPYSVVLFDEIEKAHPEVTKILLQILDDGILTDAEGTTINFRNTIIILTSNIGINDFSEICRIGFSPKRETTSKVQNDRLKSVKANALRELENSIRPELLNRLDDIIVFSPLCLKDIRRIAQIEIQQLQKKLARQDIALEIGKPVIEALAKKSMAAGDGARPVRKNIREALENKIANIIVFGKVKNGKIRAEVKKNKIILK